MLNFQHSRLIFKQITGVEPAFPAWEASVIPIDYICIYISITSSGKKSRIRHKNKRVMGIEPTYPAWKAGVLPLNYTREQEIYYHIILKIARGKLKFLRA